MHGRKPAAGVIWEIKDPKLGTVLRSGLFLAAQRPGRTMVVAYTANRQYQLGEFEIQVEGSSVFAGDSRHAELLDPHTWRWSTVGAMWSPRLEHSATLLFDGSVLVLGGRTVLGGPEMDFIERFDPKTLTFRLCHGRLVVPRAGHLAIQLRDGRVLVLGGTSRFGLHVDCPEVYDPRTETSQLLGPCPKAEIALPLRDGRIAVLGEGFAILDPWTGQVARNLAFTPRLRGAQMAQLQSGKLLIVGGLEQVEPNVWKPLLQVMAFDPNTLEVHPRGALQRPHWNFLLWGVGQEFHLVGGLTGRGVVPWPAVACTEIEVFDRATWDTRRGPPLLQPLMFQPGIQLDDAHWLAAGGRFEGVASAEAWLCELPSGTLRGVGPLAMARRLHTLSLLQDGRVLAIGGLGLESHPAPLAAHAKAGLP